MQRDVPAKHGFFPSKTMRSPHFSRGASSHFIVLVGVRVGRDGKLFGARAASIPDVLTNELTGPVNPPSGTASCGNTNSHRMVDPESMFCLRKRNSGATIQPLPSAIRAGAPTRCTLARSDGDRCSRNCSPLASNNQGAESESCCRCTLKSP